MEALGHLMNNRQTKIELGGEKADEQSHHLWKPVEAANALLEQSR